MPRYLLYARKSSESEDRQVLSIDSQVHELTELARSRDLAVAGVLAESRSAKAPGRPVFGELMEKLTKRQVSGILCWKLDRLARNPVDGGALIWAVDQGAVSEIVTPGRSFSNRGDDKFWMQLEFGMAKKYVDDLSDNVRRGNRAKLQQGWLPGVPPLGYLNDRTSRTIVSDPDRFPLVQRIWETVLAGTAPARVFDLAVNDWNLRTRTFRRVGGGPLTRSAFYKILGNPFYSGLLVRNEEAFVGAHQAMVTKDEFDRVQEILGRPNRPPTEKHRFAFTGLIRCGECGSSVTAEEQVNRYGYHYRYYHCTKKRRGVSCTQKAIRSEQLATQIHDQLSKIRLPDGYSRWALRHLSVLAVDESSARKVQVASLERTYGAARKRTADLLDLRLRGLLSDEEFLAKKQDLAVEEVRLREQLEQAKTGQAPTWLEPSQCAISFATLAAERFCGASAEEQRAIVLALGSNLTLRDRILRILLQQPFQTLDERKGCGSWWARLYAHRTFFREHPHLIQWPSFCREWVARKKKAGGHQRTLGQRRTARTDSDGANPVRPAQQRAGIMPSIVNPRRQRNRGDEVRETKPRSPVRVR